MKTSTKRRLDVFLFWIILSGFVAGVTVLGSALSSHPARPRTTPTVTVTVTAGARVTPRASRSRRPAIRPAPRTSRPSYGLRWSYFAPRIRQCESGNDYRSVSRISSASGAYQFLDSTWSRFDGYRRAYLAPRSVQDRAAYLLYLRAGLSPWNATRSCWRAS